MATSTRSRWRVPTLLILLSVIPVAAGAVRVAQLTGGARITPGNARFFADPLPVLVHIPTASLYCVLGPLQFVPAFRRRLPAWHRVVGRLLVACGLAAGLAGLWMTLFYPLAPGDVEMLRGFRVVFGSAMVACLVLGIVTIRRRDIAGHRAWMIRAYAIAQGAGTQAVLGMLWLLFIGSPAEGLGKALLLTAGWLINIALAEWIVRRPAFRIRSGRSGKAVRNVEDMAGGSDQPARFAISDGVSGRL